MKKVPKDLLINKTRPKSQGRRSSKAAFDRETFSQKLQAMIQCEMDLNMVKLQNQKFE